MGDIADAIIGGEMCEWCGVWLEDDDDWPHLCPECEREKKKDEKGKK